MAGTKFAPFVGPSGALGDRKTGVQRSVNLYVAHADERGAILESAPGLEAFKTMPGTVRGWVYARDTWFVAAGSRLYTLALDGTATEIGNLATAAGFVSFKETRDAVVLVDGVNGYVYTFATATFAGITDMDWRGSEWVEELAGFSIFVDPATDQFYISEVDNATSLDALDFSSADAQPDDIVTHRVVKQEVLFLGTKSIETWVLSGDPDFPFTRYNSTPIDVGVVGKRAAINAADTLYWIGQTGRGPARVYEMQGHQPVRISTDSVEEAIAACTDIASASMWTYEDVGTEFIALQLPGVATTWVYDAASKLWHERCELVDGEFDALRVEQVIFIDGCHYAYAADQIYRMARDVYSIAGEPLVRERTWPHLLTPDAEPRTYSVVELQCTTGYDGTEGFITLEISNDGGHVWGSPLIRSLGVVGQRMQRVRWFGLGASRDRVFRVRCTSAVPLSLYAAHVGVR